MFHVCKLGNFDFSGPCSQNCGSNIKYLFILTQTEKECKIFEALFVVRRKKPSLFVLSLIVQMSLLRIFTVSLCFISFVFAQNLTAGDTITLSDSGYHIGNATASFAPFVTPSDGTPFVTGPSISFIQPSGTVIKTTKSAGTAATAATSSAATRMHSFRHAFPQVIAIAVLNIAGWMIYLS